jgi:hypothetical protein
LTVEGTTKPIEVRQSSVALWSGIMAGPLAWAVNLEARYALVPWACAHGARWVLLLVAAVTLAVSLAGFLFAWQGGGRAANDPSHAARIRFMAIAGFMLSGVFTLMIVSAAIPDFFFHPCD